MYIKEQFNPGDWVDLSDVEVIYSSTSEVEE